MKPALLLVDIQNDYFPGGKMELENIDIASTNARLLLDKFRDKELQTFHIKHTFTNSTAKFFLPSTEGSEIHGCIDPLPDEIIVHKHFPNSFRETNLLNILNKKNITDLVICGAMSHMCIEATTRAAADYGFNCIVVQDACATRDIEFRDKVVSAVDVHNASMAALAFAYANVVNTSELL
jgi:nicotinamidase-related amidase